MRSCGGIFLLCLDEKSGRGFCVCKTVPAAA